MTIARLPLSCARTYGVVDVGRCVHRMVGNVEDDVSRRQTLFGSKPVGIYISDGNSLAICDGSERQAKRRWFLLLRLSCGLEWGDWKLSQPHRNGAFAAVAKNGDLDDRPRRYRTNLGSKIRAACDRAPIDGEDDITGNDAGLGKQMRWMISLRYDTD